MKIFLHLLAFSIRPMTRKLATSREAWNELFVGYKVHLTETCDEDQPHLITQVTTTVATTTDDTMVVPIYEDLKQHELLPGQHWLDSGYITSKTLVSSQEDLGIEVIGPTRANYKWQARHSPGFDSSHASY